MRQTVQAMAHSGSRRPFFAARIVAAIRRMTARIDECLSRPALNRRVLYRLSVLSERELADIGLTRADVVEAAMPENGDATHFLVRRRDERWDAHRDRRKVI